MLQKIQTIDNTDPFDAIKKYDVISFDVFDTAIIRPFLHHNDMYYILEKILNIPKFHDTRIKAEFLTRRRLIHQTKTKEEITLLDIYEHIPIARQNAINKEIQLDLTICRQRKFIFQIYQAAIQLGKKVIFVSDITYPKKAIEHILHKSGYSMYDGVYVSSEENLSKHHGGMYKKILLDTKISPRKILHIGDSIRADIHQARRHGMKCLYIPRPYHSIQKVINEKKFQIRKTVLDSALFASAANIVFNNPSNDIIPQYLYTFPFIFKLFHSTFNTENNVFLADEIPSNNIFHIFEEIHLDAIGEAPKTIYINCNHIYASYVRSFKDLFHIKEILTDNEFLFFLKTCFNIEETDDDVLEGMWERIEIKCLEIRSNVLQIISSMKEKTIYNFTQSTKIVYFMSILLDSKLNVINYGKLLHDIIKDNTKTTIIGRHKPETIFQNIALISNQDVQTYIKPQIKSFFEILGPYMNFIIQ